MNLNLGLSESEEMLKKAALDFIHRDVPNEVIKKLQESETGLTDELWKKAVDMGWLGMVIPEQYGGTGSPLTTTGVLFEALGSAPMPGPYFSSGVLSSLIVMEAGTEEQKQSILPAIAEGKQVLTLALTEPAYSWEPDVITTKATKRNGGFTISGTKLFTIDAGAATHFIVATRSGRKVSFFIVDRKAPGVSVRQLPGFFSLMTSEVKFDSVKVTASARLGEDEDAWPALTRAIDKSIPVLCAFKVGGCQQVVTMALDYSRTRVQFDQPIGRFQRVQDMIIEMVNYTDGARWTTYEALWKLDTNRPSDEGVHLAKAVASEAYWQVCTLAHRVFSGVSYSKEHPVSFHTRASRYLYNYLGDPSYHRQKLAQLILSPER